MINRQVSGKNYPLVIKLTLICFFFLILLLLVFRPSYSPNSKQLVKTEVLKTIEPKQQQQPCRNLPASISEALIHYATSNITPQQTLKEISVTERVLRQKSPCNFLVFGLGYDSLLWSSLNSGGRTVFLEENASWIKKISSQFTGLRSLHVTYDTKVLHADDLLRSAGSAVECGRAVDPRESECVLAMKRLPEEVYEVEWDVIMVDAPTGYHDEAPGRMSALYTAGLLARNRRSSGETDVMVHDVDRKVEDRFSRTFLCEGYLKEQEGRLRHFVVPSHRDRPDKPFCP